MLSVVTQWDQYSIHSRPVVFLSSQVPYRFRPPRASRPGLPNNLHRSRWGRGRECEYEGKVRS